jgi:hypothetical protein
MRGCRRFPEQSVAHFTRHFLEAAARGPGSGGAFPPWYPRHLKRDGMCRAKPGNESDVGLIFTLCPDAVVNDTGSKVQSAFYPQGGKRAQESGGIRAA